MSFASDIKNELALVVCDKNCCKRAECYAMLLFSRSFNESDISFQTESQAAAKRYAHMLKLTVGVSAVIRQPTAKGGMYTVSVLKKDIQRVLDYFYHTGREVVLRINRANVEFECCQHAFIRGAFLCCGTTSNPALFYHAEFLVQRKQLSLDFINLLEEAGLSPKITERAGAYVIYFKDSGGIEDLLTMMHATNSSLSLMNIKIEKDIRNRVNRRTNCETANIDRTMRAVEDQISAINIIERHGGLGILPKELYEVALLRKENPYTSLSELSRMMDNTLSRSGINHRLKKITEYAEKLEKDGQQG